MTEVIDRTEQLFQRPATESLPVMRAQGLLPASTTERVWKPDPAEVQPSFASLAQIDPRLPYTAGRAATSVYGAQWFSTGGQLAEVSIRTQPGTLSGILYLDFGNLGANRKCIAWFDLRVYTGSSVTLAGTGNPSTVVVSQQATGGQRVSVPLALTALSDGRAYAYLVPTLTGHGGAWYGTTVYGL